MNRKREVSQCKHGLITDVLIRKDHTSCFKIFGYLKCLYCGLMWVLCPGQHIGNLKVVFKVECTHLLFKSHFFSQHEASFIQQWLEISLKLKHHKMHFYFLNIPESNVIQTAWLLHLESFAEYFKAWYMGQFRNLVKTMTDFSCDCF